MIELPFPTQVRRSVISITLGAAALAAPATAQRHIDDPASTEAMVVMGERNREAIHPGRALEVSGLGAEGNDFLESMPTLSRGEFVPVVIDRQAAYESQLAMYEGGRRDAPFRTTRPTRERTPGTAQRYTGDGFKERSSPRNWAIIAGMASVAAVVIGFFLSRD